MYSGQEDRQGAGDRDGDRQVDQRVRDLHLGPPHLDRADHPGPVRPQLCKLSTRSSRAARDAPKSLKVQFSIFPNKRFF